VGVDRAKGSWGDVITVFVAFAFAVGVAMSAGWVYGLPAWVLVILTALMLRTRRSTGVNGERIADTPELVIDSTAHETVEPMVDGTQFVRIQRDGRPWRDRYRSYRIVLDGNVVGKVRAGAEAVLPVEPGPHSLVLRIDSTGSSIEFFNVLPGQTVTFTCYPIHSDSKFDVFRKVPTIIVVLDSRRSSTAAPRHQSDGS
jgi:hypothetical protein